MKYEEIKNILAPCGINCVKCVVYKDGKVKHHSEQLVKHLGNFHKHAEKFSNHFQVYKGYPAFKEVLEFFTQGDCGGCRSGQCKFTVCNIMQCTKENSIDYCFQCEDFPCEKPQMDKAFIEKWINSNKRMKEIGVEAFYKEVKDLPRY